MEWWQYLKQGLKRQAPPDRLAEDYNNPERDRANLNNLRPFVRRHIRKALVGAFLILISTLLAFPQPLITRYLIDHVILGKQLNQLFIVVLLLVLVKGFSMLAGPLQNYYFTRFEQDVMVDLQSDLVARTLRLPKSFLDEQQTGYLMSRLGSDVQGLRWFFSGTLVYLATNVLRFFGGVIFLFYLEWRLALVTLVALPGIVLGMRYFGKRLRTLNMHSMEKEGNYWERLEEALSASSLIKSFSTEAEERERVTSELKDIRQITMETTTVNALANITLDILPDVSRALVLVLGAYWIIQGNWTLGSLLAFQSYLGYVFGPAYSLANANIQLQNALGALQRVSAIYDIVPEEHGKGVVAEHLKGEIEFSHVSFSYDGKDKVLEDLSFKIRPGQHVAIVGPSGVGKTTLVSLILRFYQPTAGKLLMDGRPVEEYELASLRRRIGYVSQSAMLLTGTILDNLRYGDNDASQAQIEQAARAAGIHEFIVGLPEGYLSLVGERGVNFSEGQKQRLSIARALVKNPDILVLDEPTAALDSITEKTIFDALPPLVRDKTLIVVAHRLATVLKSDSILVLNEHRLEGVGTHQELINSCKFYGELVSNQEILASS